MTKYRVFVDYQAEFRVFVEAETPDLARKMVKEQIEVGTLRNTQRIQHEWSASPVELDDREDADYLGDIDLEALDIASQSMMTYINPSDKTRSAHDVTKYFLSLVQEEDGDLMSNFKLQKLLYYAQGFYLAVFDEPLFPEDIEAWIHGPVVPAVYAIYKEYNKKAIPYHRDVDLNKFDYKTKELLNEIYAVYGQYSASHLRHLTHNEPPWTNTEKGEMISHESMRSYFKTQLIDGKKRN